MKYRRRIRVFTDRYPLIGPAIWIFSVQYYLTQIMVATAWSRPYSLLYNTISDLGNTACAQYNDHFVCSPYHAQMNVSFVTLGITMAIGSWLIFHEFKQTLASLIGFSCMALAGFGTIMVGLFPENTIANLHITGAALPFVLGNVSMIILSFALKIPKPLRVYTFSSGAIGLLALPLFLGHIYLGLGIGGTERIVAYPQSVWLIVFGIYMSRSRFTGKSRPARK